MKPLCLKVKYETGESARRALEDLRVERGRPAPGTRRTKAERRAYYHAQCGSWHLTSSKIKP